MTPIALLSALAQHGVTVALLDDGALHLTGAKAPPADLLAEMRAQKPGIVAALAARPDRQSVQPVDGGDHAERAAIEAEARGEFGPPLPLDAHANTVATTSILASPWEDQWRSPRCARPASFQAARDYAPPPAGTWCMACRGLTWWLHQGCWHCASCRGEPPPGAPIATS